MDCAHCRETIDEDSHYCDQCGAEVRTCVDCGRPGKGKRCTGCGGHVLPARERTVGTGPSGTVPSPAGPRPAGPVAPSIPVAASSTSGNAGQRTPASAVQSTPASAVQSTHAAAAPSSPALPVENAAGATRRLADHEAVAAAAPELRLLNKNIQVDIRIEHDTIIGRAAGPHVAIFSRFDQVSSRHCRFSFDPGRGWSVTDMGSTNKTLYNNQMLTPQTPQLLSDQSHLKIANIEFFVRLTST